MRLTVLYWRWNLALYPPPGRRTARGRINGLDYTHFYRPRTAERSQTCARRINCWTPAHHRLERIALAAEIMPYGLDLLHSPDFIPPLGGYRRSVITVHDLTFLLYPQFLTAASRRYYNDQIRWAVARCDAISADSDATKADLINGCSTCRPKK